MNPVFWLLVIIALVGAWFAASPFFKKIGEMVLGTKDIFENDEKENE